MSTPWSFQPNVCSRCRRVNNSVWTATLAFVSLLSCATEWRQECITCFKISLSVESQQVKEEEIPLKTKQKKNLDTFFFSVCPPNCHLARQVIFRKRKKNSYFLPTFNFVVSGENDSISIYSSFFVCHFTALDSHSTTHRRAYISVGMMGGGEGAAVSNKCLNWLGEGAARIVKSNSEPIATWRGDYCAGG